MIVVLQHLHILRTFLCSLISVPSSSSNPILTIGDSAPVIRGSRSVGIHSLFRHANWAPRKSFYNEILAKFKIIYSHNLRKFRRTPSRIGSCPNLMGYQNSGEFHTCWQVKKAWRFAAKQHEGDDNWCNCGARFVESSSEWWKQWVKEREEESIRASKLEQGLD